MTGARWAGAFVLVASIGMAIGAYVGGRMGVGLAVGCSLAAAAVVAWAWRRTCPSMRLVLGVAFAARLILFPLPPTLSDDGYRYVWDGLLQTEGLNPYRHTPEALAERDPALFERLNSPAYYSVYPPASQLVFGLGAVIARQNPDLTWFAIKGLLLLIEGIGLVLLARMAAPAAVALYAWNPLVLMETAGQAHTEASLVGFMLAALFALRRRKPWMAGAALAAAVWVKLIPILLVPFTQRMGWRGGAALVAVLVLLAGPYAAPGVVGNVVESLGLYVRLFEWNGGPYLATKELLRASTGEDWSKVLGPVFGGAFGGFLAALWLAFRVAPAPTVWAWIAVQGGFLFFATTVHPWYLLGVLCLLPLTIEGSASRRHAGAWEWLAAGSTATYLFYAFGTGPYVAAVVLGWTGWAVLMLRLINPLLQLKLSNRGTSKWNRVAPFLPERGRLLDLGAGEGYVGAAAQRDGHAVHLTDVTDFHRVDLPFTHVESDRLPFVDDAFDATLLVFVLHHATHPEAVLREASRVTCGRIVVWESVVETRWDRVWLPFADRLANRLRARIPEPLGHRSARAWRSTFEALDLRIVYDEALGDWRHRQHLFVLERDPSRR